METPDPKYKHKPSEKHTLEEVLKSLQDLIHNDLIESDAGTDKPEAPATHARQSGAAPARTPEAKQRRESKPVVREDFAPVSPGSGPVNLDAVMRSLKDLIGNELNVGDGPKPASEKPAAAHEEYLSTDEKIEEYVPDELAELDEELGKLEKHAVDDSEPATEETIVADLPKELTPFDSDLTIEAMPAPAAPIEHAEVSGEIAAEPASGMAEPAPEEFAPLDEELTLEEPLQTTPPMAAPTEMEELPGDMAPELEQNPGEPAPEEFTPLDEELTFEEPLQPAPANAAPPETAELPGEISPELFEEAVMPETAAITPPPAPAEEIAPGMQHEMFLDAPPHVPEPEIVASDSVPLTTTQAAPAPAPEAPADKREEPVEAKQEGASEVLPTIDVEESFDDNDYFAAPAVDENPPPASDSEETIALDAEIPPERENVARPVAKTPAPPVPPEKTSAPEATAAPAEPAKKKITLEIAEEPFKNKPRDEYSVDFDSSDLSPPLPEESDLALPETSEAIPSAGEKFPNSLSVDYDSSDLSPPLPEESELSAPETAAVAEIPAPAETAKADSVPATDSETAAPPPEPPAVETKVEPPAAAEPMPPVENVAAPEAPASSSLDDIPVLNEVVAPPASSVPKTRRTASPPKPPKPEPDRARELVVRAVAKLNIEMRKTGGAGLDTKTILRLQQLIREELEKGEKK